MAVIPKKTATHPASQKYVSGPPGNVSPTIAPEMSGPTPVAKCDTAVLRLVKAPRDFGSAERNIIAWAGTTRLDATDMNNVVTNTATHKLTEGKLVITTVMTTAPPAVPANTRRGPKRSVNQPLMFITNKAKTPATA